jgi:hypothetical protein
MTETHRSPLKTLSLRCVIARNEIAVPEKLKRGLLVECHLQEPVHEEHRLSIKDLLEKPQAGAEEDELMAEFRELFASLKANPPTMELRVKDGSYKVTNYYDEEIVLRASSHASEDANPHRAKQKIQTVKSESPFTKLFEFFYRCIKNKGNVKKRKVEKIIMDGVNLAFESGKMYLVL